jgi:hypothetical protein
LLILTIDMFRLLDYCKLTKPLYSLDFKIPEFPR